MNGPNHYQFGQPLWAWAMTTDDLNGELAKAITLYQQRFQRQPFLVICSEGLKLEPISGLGIEQQPSLPARVLYFALTGNNGAVATKEVMSIA